MTAACASIFMAKVETNVLNRKKKCVKTTRLETRIVGLFITNCSFDSTLVFIKILTISFIFSLSM